MSSPTCSARASRHQGRKEEAAVTPAQHPSSLVGKSWTREKGEPPLEAAKREFAEETGLCVDGDFVALGDFKQPGGKVVSAWLVEADCDPAAVRSNLFSMEWPPRSGKTAEFPEIDRAGWFSPEGTMAKILRGQKPIIERALEQLRLSNHVQQ